MEVSEGVKRRRITVTIVKATSLSRLIIVTEVNTTIPQQENGLKFLILQTRVMKIVVQAVMKAK